MKREISICIPAINGNHIRECLDSIFTNRFHDFEVIVNDASSNFFISDFISDYDITIIKKNTGSFESRYLTVLAAKGRKILLFDETRVMSATLLEKLNDMQNAMVVVGERDIGKGFLTFISNIDKKSLLDQGQLLNPLINKSIIPRFYDRVVISEALSKISRNLSDELLRQVVGLDLELIYLESYNITHNIGLIPTSEILHYGDESFLAVFRKYYRYGFTQKMLRGTYYSEFANLSGRNRSTSSFENRLLSLPLQIIRGVPFVLGYISADKEWKRVKNVR